MKSNKGFLKGLVAVIAVVVAWSSLHADPFNWTGIYRGPRYDLITLMITANYTKPRLLADLIQKDTKQPYILLPAKGQKRIFFCPPPSRQPAMEILESDLKRFIKFCNPKQILVIGDKRYVPKKFLKMIDPNQTVWIVSNDNWIQAARSVAKLLDLTNLAYDYKKLCEKLDGGQLYRPTKPEKIEISDKETIIDEGDGGKVEINEATATESDIQVPAADGGQPDEAAPAAAPAESGKASEPEMDTSGEPILIKDNAQ